MCRCSALCGRRPVAGLNHILVAERSNLSLPLPLAAAGCHLLTKVCRPTISSLDCPLSQTAQLHSPSQLCFILVHFCGFYEVKMSFSSYRKKSLQRRLLHVRMFTVLETSVGNICRNPVFVNTLYQ